MTSPVTALIAPVRELTRLRAETLTTSSAKAAVIVPGIGAASLFQNTTSSELARVKLASLTWVSFPSKCASLASISTSACALPLLCAST